MDEETGRGMGAGSRAGRTQHGRGAGSQSVVTLPGSAVLGGSVLRCGFDYCSGVVRPTDQEMTATG